MSKKKKGRGRPRSQSEPDGKAEPQAEPKKAAADDASGWPGLGAVATILAVLSGIAASLATLTQVFDQPFHFRLWTIGIFAALALLGGVYRIGSAANTSGTTRSRKRRPARLLTVSIAAAVSAGFLEWGVLQVATDYKSADITVQPETATEKGRVVLRAPHAPIGLDVNISVAQTAAIAVVPDRPPHPGTLTLQNKRPFGVTVRLDDFGDRSLASVTYAVSDRSRPKIDAIADNTNVECLDEATAQELVRRFIAAGVTVCGIGLLLVWSQSRWRSEERRAR